LNNLYFTILEKLISFNKSFNFYYYSDLNHILETNLLPKKSKIDFLKLEPEKRTPPVKKEYEILRDYCHIVEETHEKVKTKLKPSQKK